MAPPPQSAVTRFIWLCTLAAVAIVATLTYAVYRSAVDDAVERHATQQLAMVRTAAVGIEGEIASLTSQLLQFNSLPSVQSLDPVLNQRINAAFGLNTSGPLNFIARADARGRLYYWTPAGEQRAAGEPIEQDPAIWAWASNPANMSKVRIIRGWSNSRPTRRALVVPVWRTAPSAENPTPDNQFNGLLAMVVDLNRFAEVYLGPALDEPATGQVVAGLATPDFGVVIRPGGAGVESSFSDAHHHVERQGTSVLDDAGGRRVHAWAKFTAADETWMVASSADYDAVAGQTRRSVVSQLALSAALLVAIPLVGFVIARRERRAHDEQRRLERQLAEAQKMEAIGKLAGGVAHDFNNMLTAILGYASMIAEDAPPGSPIQDQAVQIRRAAESAAALTQKLLAFSRRQVLQTNHVDLAAMLDSLSQLIRRVIGETIAVTTETDAAVWPILADPVQVEQAIINLAINARDAMPNGGTLRITARNTTLADGERRADGEVKPGDYVRVTVADSGVGMDETTRLRMFEPFFTTKPHGQGTGLGLSTVYGFVRQCGGHVSVESAPGQGTTIELLLPRAPAAPATPARTPATPVSDSGQRGSETVLVVEDEEAVRQLAVQSLERHGYRVLAAAGGEEALRLAVAYDETIHLLLSDVVMPGMKGPELAARLRALRPGIRVVLMSGYAADVVTGDDLKDTTLVSKPFSSAAISRVVRQALDAR
jgi:signal transduction histidine kinase/CheY-like chemotaxis protein